jgi:hypothetical protein
VQRITLSLLLCLLVAGSFIICGGQEPPPPPPPAKDYFPKTWKEFMSVDGKFKARYPGDPKEATKTFDSEHGSLLLHSFFYGNSSFIFYSVDYRDYPSAPTNRSAVKRILEKAKENRLMGLEGKMKLVAEKETTRDGNPALYFEMEYLQTKRLRELDVISGRPHYTVLVIAFSSHGNAMGAENAYEAIATSFLDSFHVVEQ